MGNRRAFTLVELLITCVIIGMMAAMVIFAMFQASEAARVKKTQALIARIDAVIKNKWESYRTRRLPVYMPPNEPFTDQNNNHVYDPGEPFVDLNGNGRYDNSSKERMDILHELMRLELPDRWTDVEDDPRTWNYNGFTVKLARPAVSRTYKARFDTLRAQNSSWPTGEYAGAECLYMILSAVAQEDGDDVTGILKPENIRDTDGDGAPEIVDGWQMPIKFLRWAPGFPSELNTVATGTMGGTPPGAPADPHTLQFWAGGNLPVSANGILGGAIIDQEVNTKGLSTKFAQITSYVNDPDTSTNPPTPRVKITCTTPKSISGKPFNGSAPGQGETIYIVSGDAFDFQGAYRQDLNYSMTVPPFAQSGPSIMLYPLVFSAGPNKCYGLCNDFDSASPLRYSANNCNPFYIGTESFDGQLRQIGAWRNDPGEKNAVNDGWQDNIHNHLIGLR